MIIFSQGPTAHSRLGNSLDWMSKFQYYLDELSLDYFFPWAAESLAGYLNPDSRWISSGLLASELFVKRYNLPLTAKSISDTSRSIEHSYEVENYLDPYGWRRLVYSDAATSTLYLTGNVDITSPDIVSAINSHELTICHEPFNFIFRKDFSLIGLDYTGLSPRSDLYQEQLKFVQERSGSNLKVGFHIRRGDYRYWQNGIYCYDDSYWLINAKKFIELGCSVWVFSNDLETSFVNKLLELGVNVSCSDFEVDFVRMMFMDKIYGPPSTFSVSALKISSELFSSGGRFFYLPSKQ